MVPRNYIPIPGIKKHLAILIEKRLLKKYYPFLKFQIKNDKLFCSGFFQPTEYSPIYHYRVEWEPGFPPKVFPTIPQIEYNEDIHLYADGSLCLYYPKDFVYTLKSHLHDTILPWAHEWFVFYELYQIKGRWLHPYVEHNKI
jgi:hypothetical protein